jgi:hypothetical protein
MKTGEKSYKHHRLHTNFKRDGAKVWLMSPYFEGILLRKRAWNRSK